MVPENNQKEKKYRFRPQIPGLDAGLFAPMNISLKFIVLLLVLGVFACKGTNSQLVQENNENAVEPQSWIDKELKRLDKLMAEFRGELNKMETLPAYSGLEGVLGAVGYEVVGEKMRCEIFIFEHQQKHEEAFAFFEKELPESTERRLLMASNGPSFFVGIDEHPTEASGYILNDLASAFAGEE